MNKQRGFTLIEAAVAIGVVAILSGIIIPLVLKNVRDAHVARANNDIHVIAGAISTQFRDMGVRPNAAAGGAVALPGGCAAGAQEMWGSAGANPTLVGGAGGPINPGANTFSALFASPNTVVPNALMANAQALFGFPAAIVQGVAHGYQGPYLGLDMARKTDPWNRQYLILGYNHDSEVADGPIWVVSAGPLGTIANVNITPVNNQYPASWNYTANGSEHNIAVRVH